MQPAAATKDLQDELPLWTLPLHKTTRPCICGCAKRHESAVISHGTQVARSSRSERDREELLRCNTLRKEST